MPHTRPILILVSLCSQGICMLSWPARNLMCSVLPPIDFVDAGETEGNLLRYANNAMKQSGTQCGIGPVIISTSRLAGYYYQSLRTDIPYFHSHTAKDASDTCCIESSSLAILPAQTRTTVEKICTICVVCRRVCTLQWFCPRVSPR